MKEGRDGGVSQRRGVRTLESGGMRGGCREEYYRRAMGSREEI